MFRYLGGEFLWWMLLGGRGWGMILVKVLMLGYERFSYWVGCKLSVFIHKRNPRIQHSPKTGSGVLSAKLGMVDTLG